MTDKPVSARSKTAYLQHDNRAEAESNLAKHPRASLGETVNAEQMLHELQVHQIELEMQNKALRQAHIALEDSRDRYFDLFEFAPIGYFTLSATGLIVEVNFVGAELLKADRQQLIGQPLAKYIVPEDSDQFHLRQMRLNRDEVQQSYDMQIKRESEIKCYVHVNALRVTKDDGTLNFRITLTDISKTKLMEQDLRLAASAFEVQEGMIITDKQSKIIRVNQAFVKLTDYCADDVIGHNGTFITEKSQYPESFKSIIDRVSPLKCWQGEVWSQRRDGVVFPCLASVTAVLDNEGRISNYIGCFYDITLQKQAEKILLEEKQRLEMQVEKTSTELSSIKTESEEVNTALKVLIKMRNTENVAAKSLLKDELSLEVLPFIEKLKQNNQDVRQVRLVNTLEANLQRLVSTYGSPTTISASLKNLTPKEIQVATMVREGFSTKAIASTLALSPETISIHRKNIRRKIGLDRKDKNLRSHLMVFDNT
ncbi:MAG: hypothetical protein RLZZ379_722 [Pseudomonadota bacterium]